MFKRNRRIIIISLGFLFAILASRQGWNAYQLFKTYKQEKEYLSNSEYAHKTKVELTRELHFYKDGKEKEGKNNTFQNRLWSSVSNYAKQSGIRISRLPGLKISEENGYQIETNVFQIEGDFKKALTLVYQIEQKDCLAKISSVSFDKKEDLVTHRKALFTTVYFQNIKSNL